MKIDPQVSLRPNIPANDKPPTSALRTDAGIAPFRGDETRDDVAVSAAGNDILYGQNDQVERLKRIYDDGHYSIPSSAIAQKIVGEHEEP